MPAVRSELENQSYLALLCGAGQLDDGTPVLLHLWLVMMRQPGEYGGNGTITMQGYALFLPVHVISVEFYGKVREFVVCVHGP